MLSFLLFLAWVVFFLPPIVIAAVRANKGEEVSGGRWTFSVVWAAVGALILWWALPHYMTMYTEVLWFRQLGVEQVFWTRFASSWSFFLLALVVSLVFLLVNVAIARNRCNNERSSSVPWAALAASSVIALIFALGFRHEWLNFKLAENAVQFGTNDPVFGKDIAFYVFILPRLETIRNYLSALTWIGLILTSLMYIISYACHLPYSGYRKTADEEAELRKDEHQGISHASALGILVMVQLFFSTRIHVWDLLFSHRGAVYGAGYTDLASTLPGLSIYGGCLILAALLLFVAALSQSLRVTKWCCGIGFGTCVLSALIFLSIVPGYVQNFRVEPSEFRYEEKYLQRSMEFTRKAFGVSESHLTQSQFKTSSTGFTGGVVKDNADTLSNIRLWDWTALKSTNLQYQAFRPYYDFADVDVVRYRIGGKTVQLMTSPRELDQSKLAQGPGLNWYNRRLVYTHGYGVTANPVNTFLQPEGLPDYWVKDIPVTSRYPELQVNQPRIYFGELTNEDVYVDGSVPEFDYTDNGKNKTYVYDGKAGVELGTGLRKLAFAFRMDGWRLLKSQELKSSSRVLYHRNITERMNKIAPFLRYDNDPYCVIADGRMWFIRDAYTVSNRYPYSEPVKVDDFHKFNYIRNSVKVVIDAYNGTTDFYVFEPSDPIIQAYMKVFPGVFKPASEMPEYLRVHIRYPEDLLTCQAQMLGKYHVKDTRVFYNHEDIWEIANETTSGTAHPVAPYFVNMSFPGDKKGIEFALILPFSPLTTDPKNPRYNMVGWLAGKCDGENYGQLVSYTFPKGKLITGPGMMGARINQDENISKDITLWSQQGSTVFFGNLLVIPLNDSKLLYVQPIFLQAAAGKMPELKRVVLASGDNRLAYGSTFEDSLEMLVNGQAAESGQPANAGATSGTTAKDAAMHLANYQKLTAEGKYAQAGAELEALKQVLSKLVK